MSPTAPRFAPPSQETVKSFGRLDVFFNNAGFNKPLPFMEVDENNFNAIMRVNAWGVLVLHAGSRAGR